MTLDALAYPSGPSEPCADFRPRSYRDAANCACGWSRRAHAGPAGGGGDEFWAPVAYRAPVRCAWIIDGDAGLTCDREATRGTEATGPLCDEHGEEHERESEGR